jgi:dTMP kinase
LARGRGLFITVEGPDGSGKSTQARLLAESLKRQGRRVLLTREPGGSPLAEKIRGLLLDSKNGGMRAETELLLFEAARFQHVNDTIRPALSAGTVVLCDRYIDSTSAYQLAGRGLPAPSVAWLNRFGSDGLEPALTLLYDISEADGRRRSRQAKGGHDRMEKAGLAFRLKVRAAFLGLARKHPRRIKVIQVKDRAPEDILAEGLKLLAPKLKAAR